MPCLNSPKISGRIWENTQFLSKYRLLSPFGTAAIYCISNNLLFLTRKYLNLNLRFLLKIIKHLLLSNNVQFYLLFFKKIHFWASAQSGNYWAVCVTAFSMFGSYVFVSNTLWKILVNHYFVSPCHKINTIYHVAWD